MRSPQLALSPLASSPQKSSRFCGMALLLELVMSSCSSRLLRVGGKRPASEQLTQAIAILTLLVHSQMKWLLGGHPETIADGPGRRDDIYTSKVLCRVAYYLWEAYSQLNSFLATFSSPWFNLHSLSGLVLSKAGQDHAAWECGFCGQTSSI